MFTAWARTTHKTVPLIFGALVCCFAGLEAEASIIVPDSLVVDARTLLKDMSNTGSTSAAAIAQRDSQEEREQDRYFVLFEGLLESNSSSSSSTTSSGGSGGPSCSFVHSLSDAVVPDLDCYGWAISQVRFTLPAPPGIDLLRPPQLLS